MSRLAFKTQINAPASAVWKTLRDFGGLGKFVASVARCSVEGSGVGALRTITFSDGSRIIERLESLDDAGRTLSYSITQGALPFENYVSTMKVRDLPQGGCELAWVATCTPTTASEAEVKAIIQGVYSEGFAGLKKLHGG